MVMETNMEAFLDKVDSSLKNTLHNYYEYETIIKYLMDGCEDADYPNVLLYGCQGFPQTLLWDAAVERKYGDFKRRECVWNKEWIYSENPYFFEIDFLNPSQPKDVISLGDFLKEIISHPCIHASRHIFILKHIDQLCTRGYVYMLRVLLERFCKNAWFICTTYHISAIEKPIRSRFLMFRIPLLKTDHIREIISGASLHFPEECNKHLINDLNVATFLSLVPDSGLPYRKEDFCKFHAPFIQDTLNQPSPTIAQIRALTQKLSVHGFSLSQISMDLLQFIKKPKDQHAFIMKASEIDHMYSSTERYRKPLYIELLLHTAIYGFSNTKK